MWSWLYKLASPKTFYHYAYALSIWFGIAALVLITLGTFSGLVLAPADYQQGDAFRIMYIHVPSAFMSLGCYTFMGFCAVLFLVWRIKLADIMVQSSAVLGAWMTVLALISGALWGKPMWGTWWIWDARLTSELILLFLYIGIIALRSAFDDKQIAANVCAILVLVGIVNIPIIHYSVYWWNTLHQGTTLSLFNKPKIAPAMLYPLLIMILGFVCYFIATVLVRARTELLAQEYHKHWVQELMQE
ncbi:MAG: heme ABC transporter permease CcmC [Gammaproteobacteria bacterium]